MHEQEVVAVVFQSEIVGDTGSHWHSRYTGVADERIELFVFWQEYVHQLNEQYSTHGSHDECTCSDGEDEYSVHGKEL